MSLLPKGLLYLVGLASIVPAASVGRSVTAKPVVADIEVRVGGDAGTDACNGLSVVTGLDPKGNGFLAVKAAPNLRARRIAKLRAAKRVFTCGATPDGRWVAIVYEGEGQVAECGVTSPIVPRQPYCGPCRSGWVSARYLKLIAG